MVRSFRGEYRRACPPRRELQPAQRAHHPKSLPCASSCRYSARTTTPRRLRARRSGRAGPAVRPVLCARSPAPNTISLASIPSYSASLSFSVLPHALVALAASAAASVTATILLLIVYRSSSSSFPLTGSPEPSCCWRRGARSSATSRGWVRYGFREATSAPSSSRFARSSSAKRSSLQRHLLEGCGPTTHPSSLPPSRSGAPAGRQATRIPRHRTMTTFSRAVRSRCHARGLRAAAPAPGPRPPGARRAPCGSGAARR